MSMTSPDRIELNLFHRQRLEYLIRAGTTAQQLARRARIVLLAAAGWTNTKIAQRVGVCEDTVRKWRHRWCAAPVVSSLGDAHRSGRRPVFSPVQVAQVKAMACTPPKDAGQPLSRWSCPELAPAGRDRRDLPVDLAGHSAPLVVRGRPQTLAVPVVDLHHRPRLPAQGAAGARVSPSPGRREPVDRSLPLPQPATGQSACHHRTSSPTKPHLQPALQQFRGTAVRRLSSSARRSTSVSTSMIPTRSSSSRRRRSMAAAASAAP